MYPDCVFKAGMFTNPFPDVHYTVTRDGIHIVVFRDQDNNTVCEVPIDRLLCVASDIVAGHLDTLWAKAHLKREGYSIKIKHFDVE